MSACLCSCAKDRKHSRTRGTRRENEGRGKRPRRGTQHGVGRPGRRWNRGQDRGRSQTHTEESPKEMTTLGTGSEGNTALLNEGLADLIPSLATKEELNEWERENNLQARAWAIEDRTSP